MNIESGWIFVNVTDKACVDSSGTWTNVVMPDGTLARQTTADASLVFTVQGTAVRAIGYFPDNTTSTAQFFLNKNLVQTSAFKLTSAQANVAQPFFQSRTSSKPPITLMVKHSTFDGGSLALAAFEYKPLPGATDNGGCSLSSGDSGRDSGGDDGPGPHKPNYPDQTMPGHRTRSMSGTDIAAIVISSIVFLAFIIATLIWLHLRILKRKEREWTQRESDSLTVIQVPAGSKDAEMMKTQEPSGPWTKVTTFLRRQTTRRQRPTTVTTPAYLTSVFDSAGGATDADPSEWSRSRRPTVVPSRYKEPTAHVGPPPVPPLPGADHEKALPPDPSRASWIMSPRSRGLYTDAARETVVSPRKDDERREPRSPKSAPALYSPRRSTRS